MPKQSAREDRSRLVQVSAVSKNSMSRLLGSAGKWLKKWDLDRFDSSDLLVLLILLLLLNEGDEWDIVIALAVFLFLELTEERKENHE